MSEDQLRSLCCVRFFRRMIGHLPMIPYFPWASMEQVKLRLPDTEDEMRLDLIRHNFTSLGKRTVIYVHGGAFNFRVEATFRWLAIDTSKNLKCTVAIPHYRLAPEHPFPAARNDVIEAYKYLTRDRSKGGLGYLPSQVVFMGDSAGAGLLVSVCLEIRSLGFELPSAMYLMSPWVDLSCKTANITMLEREDLDTHLAQLSLLTDLTDTGEPNGWIRHAPFDLLHLPVWPFDLSSNYVRGINYGGCGQQENEYHPHHPSVSPIFAPKEVLVDSLPPVLIQLGVFVL